MYAQGLAAFDSAHWTGSAEAYHDWRKRVKYLWYQVQVLQNIWPAGMKSLSDELDQLGELLGDHHDLSMLRSTVLNGFPRAGATSTIAALYRRIDEVRLELEKRAEILGKRVYAERPREFTRRIGTYWQVWREGGDTRDSNWQLGQPTGERSSDTKPAAKHDKRRYGDVSVGSRGASGLRQAEQFNPVGGNGASDEADGLSDRVSTDTALN